MVRVSFLFVKMLKFPICPFCFFVLHKFLFFSPPKLISKPINYKVAKGWNTSQQKISGKIAIKNKTKNKNKTHTKRNLLEVMYIFVCVCTS